MARRRRARVEREAVEPREQRAERDVHLLARERRADAVVDAHAEGEVLGRVRARDVEAVGVGELRRVAVRGGEAQHADRAGRDLRALDLAVLRADAPHVRGGRGEAQHLLHQVRDAARGSRCTRASWSGCWISSQRPSTIADAVVSFPATSSCWRIESISVTSSGRSPSTCACTMSEMMSSCGSLRRSSSRAAK